jgi:hypothetical protein
VPAYDEAPARSLMWIIRPSSGRYGMSGLPAWEQMLEMTIEEISAAVASWAPGESLVRRVYLFGSRAKGTARPDSDIDLAILHNIDPAVPGTCDPDQEHWFTWWDHKERWTGALQARLEGRADVQQIDRESRKVVVPSLKDCRICLYRKSGEEAPETGGQRLAP